MIGNFVICFSVAPARIGALMCSAMYGMKWVFKESFGVVVSMNYVPHELCPCNSCPKLEVEILSTQWGNATCTQKAQFFSFGEKGRGEGGWRFFWNLVFPNVFPSCSH
jgi:hypothetical protein